MNQSKLDGGLAAALLRREPSAEVLLSVFIRTAPQLTQDARKILGTCGVDTSNERATVFAADLSRQQVDELSEQSWVVSIQLGQQARPLA
ncbi:MAG TPA: hypothetical protein VE422_45945 [Terriglobia bacterium]|nr:hypothetical protein [Terriglobia bacterium]